MQMLILILPNLLSMDLDKIDYEDEVSKWITEVCLKLVDYLDEDMKKCMLLDEFDQRKRLKKLLEFTLCYSILRPNGDLRFVNIENKVPNWKYIKHFLDANLIT